MTDKNDALFLVRLPFGQKTIPYEEVPELIAMAKSHGYDGEHEAVMLDLGVRQEEGRLRAAVQAGEVEVLDKSLHRMTQPFIGRLKYTVLTVQALREYVESIKGFLEVDDAPQAASETKEADALMPADVLAANNDARLSVTDQQNNAILNWLHNQSHDPLKLPVPPSGMSGVKKLCRDAVKFSSPSVFDTAWDRLRANKKIRDAK